MCLALLNVGMGSEDMVLLAFCFLPRAKRRSGVGDIGVADRGGAA